MNWFADYGTAFGLSLDLIGVVIIAVAQSRIMLVTALWLNALDFFVETYLVPNSPVVRFEGVDEQMKRAVTFNRRMSVVGWSLIAIGFLIQIPGSLP